MYLKVIKIAALIVLLSSGALQASWDASTTLTSDYLYKGVSQTGNKPALQLELNKNFERGWYAGAFASNVDFGDDTWLELNAFGGRYWQFNDTIGVELGALYYNYHGEGSDFDYTEITAALYVQEWRLQSWYSWDYAGTGAGHIIVEAAYTFYQDNHWSAALGVNQSRSLDAEHWLWASGKEYSHVWLTATRSWQHWSLKASVEHATLSSKFGGGSNAVVSASYSF